MRAVPSSSRTLRSALAILAAGAVLASPARAQWLGSTWVDGQLVDVQVRVEGRAAPLFDSPSGDSRRYLEAVAGRGYTIALRNNTAQRVGVLVAVDGLNVVTGQRTSQSSDEAMYVLGPWQSTEIRGWRTSLDDVRRFVFVDEAHSYAGRTDQANGDMGWIRVTAFRETLPWWIRPMPDPDPARDERRSNAAPPQGAPQGADAPAAPRAEAIGPLASPRATLQDDGEAKKDGSGGAMGEAFPGTGWGGRREDRVREVRFTAERCTTDRIVLRYEYASGLRALGILPDRDRLLDRDLGVLGFAQPPRW
ncbi:MAG TPA: hypothetical protein VMH61_02915 [Candidatus Acidoferrales bacterium]|nr:hypothetical protein [Candidatus Acidoferrales bacterium]